MAAQAIGSLFVSLGLDSAAFTTGIRQAQGKAAKFAANLNKRLDTIGDIPGVGRLQAGLTAMSAGVAAAAGAASAAAVAALGAMSVSAINTAAEIQNLSRIANAAPEEFQKMAYAAEQAGISQEKFSDILKDVNDRVGDFVATGGGPMADFFERIAPKVGVTAEQFRNLSGPQALQLYVDSLEKANVNQQDFTFFMEAMASDSTALLPVLRNGGKLAREYGDRLAALGGVMGNDTVAKLASMKTALREVGVVMIGLKNSLGAAFAPVVEALARGFVSMFEAGAPLRQLFDALARAIGWIAEVVGAFITVVSALVRGIWDVISAGGAWLNSVTGLGSALKWLWDSTIGGIARVLIWFANLIKATGGIGGAFEALGELAGLVWRGIIDSAGAIPPGLAAVWASIKADFFALIGDLQNAWYRFLVGIGNSLKDAGFDGAAMKVGAMADGVGDAWDSTMQAVATASSEAAAKSEEAGQIVADAFAPARAKLAELTASTNAAAAAMTGQGGAVGGGLSQALDSAGKSASGAAAKLSPLQEVMKRLREDLEKLSATAGMTDLQAKIWGDQKEAGVSAASQAGKSIAALNEQIDTLNRTKEAVDKGKDAFRNLFGSILDGVDAAKQALANLLAEIAKVQFAKGMLGLLGSTSWGAGLIKSVGGLLGENANGTSHWRGGLTQINERGEEIVQLPSGSKVFPAGLSKRMADGSGGMQSVRVTVGVDPDTGNLTAFVDERAGMAAESMGRAVSASIPSRIRQYQLNPRRD